MCNNVVSIEKLYFLKVGLLCHKPTKSVSSRPGTSPRRNLYETRVGDEIYSAIDEGEPVSVLVIPPVVATGPEMSVELVEMDKTTTERVIVKELIADMIDKILVIQLQAVLLKRGINKSGLKADVLKKLKYVVINNVLMTEDRPA